MIGPSATFFAVIVMYFGARKDGTAARGMARRMRRGGGRRCAACAFRPSGRSQDTVSADALQFQEELANVGYVWRPPGAGNIWQPGIPSLMSYIEATERDNS